MTRREWLKQNPPPREATGTRELLAVATDPAIRKQLTDELAKAAKCPQHQGDLVRHRNRPEDLFVCSTGPHFFLWTKVGVNGAGFAAVDITKPFPDLDKELGWV